MSVNKRFTPWGDEEIEALKEFSRQGFTCELTAKYLNEKFGNGRTKNAVIGKLHGMAHRENIARGRPSTNAKKQTKKPAEKKAEPKAKPVKPPTFVSLYPDVDKETIFVGEGVPTLECTACRWPLSKIDGQQHHCNEPIYHKSYCRFHYQASMRAA